MIKLNYTSLQHPVEPVEAADDGAWPLSALRVEKAPCRPSSSCRCTGTWRRPPGLRLRRDAGGPTVGYVQTAGGALPGSLSRDVAELRERGLLSGHITAAPAYGGEHEAISVTGALDAARRLGWDAILVGPGPGISARAPSTATAGWRRSTAPTRRSRSGCRSLLSPRLSSSDPRERHLGISHHTYTVLELLLAPVEVAVPAGEAEVGRRRSSRPPAEGRHRRARGCRPTSTATRLRACRRRRWAARCDEDPLFFAAPLAAGAALRRKG